MTRIEYPKNIEALVHLEVTQEGRSEISV